MRKKSKAAEKREELRNTLWKIPETQCWNSYNEKGYFCAPRTLPLILGLLRQKEFSDKKDPSSVYFELLSRHFEEGVIEMEHEADHAYAAGYFGPRATRTWRERMETLEKNGLIKVKVKGNRKYGYVLLVHPTIALHNLREAGRIDDTWWTTYQARCLETKEPSYEQIMAREHPPEETSEATTKRTVTKKKKN